MSEVKEKNWFSRNWGWLLGGGCLSLIVIVILIGVGAFYKISDSIKESEPYSHAYSLALGNEDVVAFLGEPIETNGMGSSHYSYKNGSSTTSLTIPIKGPKDEGEIVVEAEKINDEWAYSSLYVKIDGENEVIYLEDTNALEENDVEDIKVEKNNE